MTGTDAASGGNIRWEYRVAVAEANQGQLESCDGAPGPLCFMDGSPEPMTVTQALDVWGATGWELVGMVAVPRGRVQYVLKRPRHQGGWEGARIHMDGRRDADSWEAKKQQ
ncbi:MAG TPA: hypothetical protein VKX16_03260 [Chloroflexota bacterium]|nr:hypothetical protein [Chloroflexota bacterium]